MSFPNPPHVERRRAENKKKIDPKGWVLKLIFSRVGPMVKAGVSAALGWIVVKLASFGIMHYVIEVAKSDRFKSGAERKAAVTNNIKSLWPEIQSFALNLLIETAVAFTRKNK
jgi:hypothetical protein